MISSGGGSGWRGDAPTRPRPRGRLALDETVASRLALFRDAQVSVGAGHELRATVEVRLEAVCDEQVDLLLLVQEEHGGQVSDPLVREPRGNLGKFQGIYYLPGKAVESFKRLYWPLWRPGRSRGRRRAESTIPGLRQMTAMTASSG